MLRKNDVTATTELARKIRIHCLEMTSRGKSSHVASALSIADMLAVLYGRILVHDPSEPKTPNRDRFILSKGHASSAVYATLAECGYFDRELLKTHCQDGAIFSGHVSHKGVPGVELSTGSLGHGLSVGTGMALAATWKKEKWGVFVVLSDGECDEGSNWEAILFASHHRLENLTVLVDYNKIQSLDTVANTLGLEPFADKWRSFGWAVREVDGHDHEALCAVLEKRPFESGKPNCLLCHTVKGKGVSFMEESVLWHYRSPQGDELRDGLRELSVKS